MLIYTGHPIGRANHSSRSAIDYGFKVGLDLFSIDGDVSVANLPETAVRRKRVPLDGSGEQAIIRPPKMQLRVRASEVEAEGRAFDRMLVPGGLEEGVASELRKGGKGHSKDPSSYQLMA